MVKKPYCIGIAGGTASGKSTFCMSLAAQFENMKYKTYHMDAYFRPEEKRPRAKGYVTDRAYMDDNHPDTMDVSLLREDMSKDIDAGQYDLIIVEGLLVLQDEALRDMLDMKLYVDCDSDERIVRRLKRNMEWGLSFDDVAGVYLDLVRFRHAQYVEPSKWRADFIVNGAHASEKALDMIVRYVKEEIRARY